MKADTLDVRLSPSEAGLLIDSAVPWHPNLLVQLKHNSLLDHHWRTLGHKTTSAQRDEAIETDRRNDSRALKARKAARRLVALGLAHGGMSGRRVVIKRTEIGSALLARRHNELHAIAEHVGEAATEFIWWQRKRSTRTPRRGSIDVSWIKLIGGFYDGHFAWPLIAVFRKEFVYGLLAYLPEKRQYDVVKACLNWHKDNMKPVTKKSIRCYLDAELDKILSSHD